ncbi:MAG: AAA family ATPase [Candidatus Moranbacteria bacterium]|jgi:chromosome segregation protein|nr:AAA family ATPase [Candidatus Moranbacteria bacterium]MDD5652069.1 AAA family ATPase [Candidatus Moranbacteria bacterium]MDX9855608.1 AAA family ATPase [Candidatus Moranbacteria bacterium]
MYLKKLELSGFKSFANKTVVDFSPSLKREGFEDKKPSSAKAGGGKLGITAIVGPNGSGKSNIADAIRWAMGEQSMKNLRGKKSEDIIFAGSGSKGKLSYASVSLHFDNSDKRIPLDFSEVIITRKIYRSGESEYLVNGSRVRLIDVVDILAKAGVGKDSYSVVNQGMSDAVLNASLSDRRIILEDAAGVKQYQIKKIRALKKLETTKKNLEQAGSLINEIEPHLRSLSRQAKKAEKGKELRKELKEIQEKYFAFLWHSFREERDKSLGEKDNLGREMMGIQREADKLNDFVQNESKKIQRDKKTDELKKKRDGLYEKTNNLEKEIMIAEGKSEILKERLEQQNIIRSIPVDSKYVREGLERVYGNQKKLSERISSVEKLEELQDIKEFSLAIGQDIFDLKGDVEKGKVEGKKTDGQISEENKIKAELESIGKKREEALKNLSSNKEELEKISREIEAETEKDRKAKEDFFEAERRLREAQRKLSELKDRFNEAKVSMARIEVREEDLLAEAKSAVGTDVQNLKYDGKIMDRHETESKISRMKIKMEQIGGIDPLVLEEYEETKSRYDTLKQESEDLEKAIKSLRDVAKEMDREIEKVFAKAFSKINEEFSKYFRIIFGGGKARLIKTKQKNKRAKREKNDEMAVQGDNIGNSEEIFEEEGKEDKEEIGIDISACPPGKKISDLSMLSGGERSLTSLALLFAIISYNPPPFTVLDEVEAALDEANSRRFGKILSDLSGNTQFVAITHNRETMRQASYLYGATMGEDGITKLVSVKLE